MCGRRHWWGGSLKTVEGSAGGLASVHFSTLLLSRAGLFTIHSWASFRQPTNCILREVVVFPGVSALRIRIKHITLMWIQSQHFNRGFFGFFYVLYSTLLHLPPLRFHCVRRCWDRTQDCCDFGIDSRISSHSARSHRPQPAFYRVADLHYIRIQACSLHNK
jgi:hypothetical protein